MGLQFNKDYHFHPRCKKLNLTHVCFAVDLLLFARGDLTSIQHLHAAFIEFSTVSGLMANAAKSSVYFGGVRPEIQEQILSMFSWSKGELPFKYLGVPLSSRKLTVIQCQPLIKKIMTRIDSWASKLLSYAGRIQLIKSVLLGIQAYWCQVFVIPQKVLKLIQVACRSFLWTGSSGLSKRALVAWDSLCLPKVAGGWNIINIKIWNVAAICKLFWNLAQKKDRAWIQWIHGYYIKHRNLTTMEIPTQASWVVRKIFGVLKYFVQLPGGLDILQQPQFSINKMYQQLRGVFEKVNWRKLICNNPSPPKCIFITWLALRQRLMTCENLQKIGINCEQTCILCDNENETLEHIFFACPFSWTCWQAVLNWMGYSRTPGGWIHEVQFCIQHVGGKSTKHKQYRMCFSIAVYLIWKERNARRFQNKIQQPREIIRNIQYWACLKHQL